jgi:hypothetical protein
VAYGAIIASDLAFGRSRAAVVWGVAALTSWLAFIAWNGYGPRMLLRTLRTAGPVETFSGIPVAAATLQTFATPALLLCCACGFFLLVRRKSPRVLLVLLGMVLVARYLPFGVPKWLLVAAPGLMACALIGFSYLWQLRSLALRAALAACVALPWTVGVHAVFGDSAYGPGFQVRPFGRPASAHISIRPVAGAGALVPTSEGPRPVGGHAWVLLGGWRANVRQAAGERERAIREAIARGIPMLQDLGQGYTVATLAGMRFTTADSWKRLIDPSFLEERRFQSADGRARVSVLRLRDRDSLFALSGIARLRELAGSRAVVIYGYTSTLRRCYLIAPGALAPLGATAALLDLEKLRLGAAKMTASAAARPE